MHIFGWANHVYETLRCKPIGKNKILLKQKPKQICLNASTTDRTFILENGLVGQSRFTEVSDLIKQSSLSNVRLEMIGIKGFNAESPLNIDTSNEDTLSFFFFTLEVSRFEFFDNNGDRVRTCDQFKRLNSSRGYFFNFNKGFDASSNSYLKSDQAVNSLELNYVRFNKEAVCEIVFKNLKIGALHIAYMIQTFFKTSMLKFEKLDNKTNLNADIEWVYINGFDADLSDSLLSPNVSFNVFTF